MHREENEEDENEYRREVELMIRELYRLVYLFYFRMANYVE